MREIRIGETESGQRLDKFLRRYLPGAGSGFLYRMLRQKKITLNGAKAAGAERLAAEDRVQIFFSDETIRHFQNPAGPAERVTERIPDRWRLRPEQIVYEDSSLLLVNKPSGLLSQRAAADDVSLAEVVADHLHAEGKQTGDDRFLYRPGPANRLDRNTSGLVAVPLTLSAARELSAAFRERTLKKCYLTMVHGRFPETRRLRAWQVRDERSRRSRIIFEEQSGADAIETVCIPLMEKKDTTLLLVELVTGKTHQIRSHLLACGHPVAGDPKYYIGKKDTEPARQFLHAWKLTFPQMEGCLCSVSGRTFTAPLPDDLTQTLRHLGYPTDPGDIRRHTATA